MGYTLLFVDVPKQLALKERIGLAAKYKVLIKSHDLIRYVYRNRIITQDLFDFPSAASNLEKDIVFLRNVFVCNVSLPYKPVWTRQPETIESHIVTLDCFRCLCKSAQSNTIIN